MNNKLKSRKFIVWLVATIFLLLSFVCYFVIKDSTITDVMKIFAEGWCWISAIYIGGNVAQKFTDKTGSESE